MNILFLNWRDIKNPKCGGAEIILYEFVKRLVKDGHRVTWFCHSFPGALPKEVIDGFNVVRRGNKFTVYLHAFLYYKKLKQKPDLVIDCVNTICWQTPFYVEKKRRVLYANQAAREVFFYEYPFPLSLISYLLEPFQYYSYKNTKTLCYSNSIKEDLISFGIPGKNINVFPLGIDHKRYVPGEKFPEPTFVVVSRFVKNKRIDICIRAMSMVIEKASNTKLFLVGYGEDEKRLTKLIERLKLAKHVFIVNKNNIFFEESKKDMKVKYMQGAWGIVLVSAKEGWGMVVTEAAACSTPAIVVDVTGLRDSVIRDKTGIILTKNPKDKEVASAIIELIENKEKRKRLSENGLSWSKNFTWEKSYKEFKKLTF